MKDYIDAASLKNMILCAAEALNEHREEINELNVFPVPDGDTGTNMALTMQSAADELHSKTYDTVEQVSSATANSTLRGARGNSGVITSLLFRGISKRLKGLETAGTTEFAGALKDGVDAAYKAVMKPAEGTILTVSKQAAKAACKAAELGADMEGMFICAIKAGNEALTETREINPVLKKAGVVDAGGKGFMVMLEAMLACLRGEKKAEEENAAKRAGTAVFEQFMSEEITFAFDTVFIVRKRSEKTDLSVFRQYLDSVGDSIVIGESDDSFKVHVHTDIPGNVLIEAQKYGQLEVCKIENMRMQHEDLLSKGKARSVDDLEREENPAAPVPQEPEKEYGVVAVCAGSGLEELFRELGTDGLVTGGQTMNPSTEELLKEIGRTNAKTVFVLPNNKNIIMAAEQCIPLCPGRNVVVVPTRSVPQGIAAMLAFDPASDPEEIRSSMTEAAEGVHTAMVTYAARDSDFDGHTIKEGEYLALLDGKLIGNYPNLRTLYTELSWAFNDLNPKAITVYYGQDVSEENAEELAQTVSDIFPDADVSVIPGGQPVYYYMISVE